MTKLLLSLHVLAAIIAIGPVTVAASMFPAAARRALADPDDPRAAAVCHNLHRICRVYAVLGVLVPVFGLATASSLGVLTEIWLIASMVLTAAAAAVLALLVLPGQATVVSDLPASSAGPSKATASPDGAIRVRAAAARLGMVSGVFNLLWAVVVVLMIIRPGSTTGA